MDGYITVSAKTLDDAITEALIQLGVTSDHLDYEVIEKGSAGFLGIGMKQAVIKARRKQEEPVEEPVVEEVEEKPVKKEVKEFKEEKKDFHKKEFHKKEHVKKDNFKKEAPKKEFVKKEVPKREVPKREVELAPVEDATKEACVKFVKDVLAAMDMNDVEVKAEIDEEGALSITMDGKNMGILIGKRGQTLDSLQYLTNRVANKMQDGYVRVKLDTEDYRRRRKQTLENLAKNIASKVKRTRRSVSLEPMNPYERRIIHSALQSDSAVSTHSEGEEPYRRVVVTLVRR
ncbi:r3H domain protein [Dorea sp. CAG:105]|nr:r3H domain protein [Dorea sp. CAG:105]